MYTNGIISIPKDALEHYPFKGTEATFQKMVGTVESMWKELETTNPGLKNIVENTADTAATSLTLSLSQEGVSGLSLGSVEVVRCNIMAAFMTVFGTIAIYHDTHKGDEQ